MLVYNSHDRDYNIAKAGTKTVSLCLTEMPNDKIAGDLTISGGG
jgi:hypothetical protein